MPDPDGAKKTVTINLLPLVRWLWSTDRVQKFIRRFRRRN